MTNARLFVAAEGWGATSGFDLCFSKLPGLMSESLRHGQAAETGSATG